MEDIESPYLGKTTNPSSLTLSRWPCLASEALFNVLVRFRRNPVGIASDVKEMYLQIEVKEQGPVSRTSRELFGPEKLVVKLQSARFEKLIFLHAFNMRKIKRIAKFEGLEPRRCEDIKGIVVPDIGPKSFGTFEKQAPGPVSLPTAVERP